MPQTWKTVRVFISSTFRDMHAERDHLVRFIFPRPRDLAVAHGCRFQAFDLRWGVSGNSSPINQKYFYHV